MKLKRSAQLAIVSVVVHQELELTERVVVGELTIVDIMTEIDRFYGGQITKHVMWNLSDALFSTINPADVERVSTVASPLIKTRVGGKSAVVATSDLGYGLSRMYQAYREMHEVTLPLKIFRVRQEAIDWLLTEAE